MFYPPKGRLLADSCRGPIVFTYVLFWVSKTLEAFQFTGGFLPKKIPEKALFGGTDGTGWTDGTAGTGYQKCPLNFFILCGYIDYVYVYLYTK